MGPVQGFGQLVDVYLPALPGPEIRPCHNGIVHAGTNTGIAPAQSASGPAPCPG